MTENKETQFNKIDFAKKMKDANSDIDKINEILADISTFHHKADDLYNELSKNFDYAPYIFKVKAVKGMLGNIPFRDLKHYQKRNVFAMIREAIETYIAKELIDKMCGDENGKANKN